MSKDWEDIKVNRRSSDRVVFESPFVQSIYDKIGFIKDETTEILREMDTREFKENLDEIDVEKFGRKAVSHFEDFADDVSSFRDEVINKEDVPGFIRKSSKDFKMALNRDEDYVRRAKYKLDKLDSDEMVDVYKTNIRAIELCNKAIRLNSKNHEAYYVKGLALTNIEKYDEAIDEFIASLALNDDSYVRLAIANVNRLKGDFDDAISVYDSLMDEDSFNALKGKAYTYYDLEDYKKASDCFKQASAIESLDSESKKIWDECIEK